MFTGIVQTTGQVTEIRQASAGHDARLRVDSAALDLDAIRLGDSIAVAGVCLTVVAHDHAGFEADVSAETLACTTLGSAAPGTRVNLETALRLETPLGGHLVSGHVDGVGTLLARREEAGSRRLRLEVPAALARYVAAKGSICVDGVSLTVNEVEGTAFGVNIVPHTLEITTLGALDVGARVNLEVDVVARYLERLLEGRLLPGGG